MSRSIEVKRKFEAAGLDDLQEVVHAGGDGALLPAGDERSRPLAQLGKLVLRQPGSRPSLSYEIRSAHDVSLRHRVRERKAAEHR